MAEKIIQMQMRHLNFNLKDLFSNRKGFVILTSLLRFKNKSREFRECTEDFQHLGGLKHQLAKRADQTSGGGGTQLFFFVGRCVPHGFPKVGSRERIFLEK